MSESIARGATSEDIPREGQGADTRPPAPSRMRSALSLGSSRELTGYVADEFDPARRFVVELRLDGEPMNLARAELFDPELLTQGLGDGCYGFAFALPAGGVEAETASVVIANTDIPVGSPVDLGGAAFPEPAAGRSHVAWSGGLRLSGWIEAPRGDAPAPIAAYIDGQCVAEAEADFWGLRKRQSGVSSALRFELDLPQRWADGAVHRVHVRDADGRELTGSPCEVVAFADGLEALVREQAPRSGEELRGRLFDRLCPRSLPFAQYSEWMRCFPRELLFPDRTVRVAVALVGEQDIEASLASLEAQQAADWVAASLPDEGSGVAFSAEALRVFIEENSSGSDAVLFARSGTRFAPTALNDLVGALIAAPQAPMAYGDLVIRAEDGSLWPLAFSAFDYERSLEQGYTAHLFALRVDVALAALAGGATDLYRLANFALDRTHGPLAPDDMKLAEIQPLHCPGFLAEVTLADPRVVARRLAEASREHLRATGRADVEARAARGAMFPALHLRHAYSGASLTLVTPLVGSRDRLAARLAAARRAASGLDHEILLVSEFRDPEFEAQVSSEFRFLKSEGPASLERCANLAMTAASGDNLFFFDPDMEGLDAAGLRDLLARMAAPGVAAVGPALRGGDGDWIGAGYALGTNFSVAPRFAGAGTGAPLYGDLGDVAHEVSAVSLSGMLTRRDLLRRMDGLDLRQFRRRFADIDYCLRLRSAGYRIVCEPRVQLTTRQTRRFDTPRSFEASGVAVAVADDDLAHLRSRWGEALMNDPFYSPLLALDGSPFRGLAWPTRSLEARTSALAAPALAPPGF